MIENKTSQSKHWAERLAEQVVKRFPDTEVYVTSAGISPSGIVHVGNFRDVLTCYAVVAALDALGKKVRFLYFWDDYDRFRKVPVGIPSTWSEHIGKPLSAVPAPSGSGWYADSFVDQIEKQFEVTNKYKFGFKPEYIRQSVEYQNHRYDDLVIQALNNREAIANILLSLMSDKAKKNQGINAEKYKAEYYPVSVYAKSDGTDFTKITNWDPDSRTLTYQDREENLDTVVIGQDTNIKLAWKVDWAMRWHYYGVNFEPFGADHAAPGSSYDASSQIVRAVYRNEPPEPQPYGFVGIEGAGKMSGSAGGAVSPNDFLDVYETPMFQWLYLRRNPKQNFKLSFGNEVIRQYDEFDREVNLDDANELDEARKFALEKSFWLESEQRYKNPIPFRQAVGYGQVIQWNLDKLKDLLTQLGERFDEKSVAERLDKARNWLIHHNLDQMIVLLPKPNVKYLDEIKSEPSFITRLQNYLLDQKNASVQDWERIVYQIPKDDSLDQKENSIRQRAFFTDIYNLLIGKGTGPRLSTFIWASDKNRLVELLSVVKEGKA